MIFKDRIASAYASGNYVESYKNENSRRRQVGQPERSPSRLHRNALFRQAHQPSHKQQGQLEELLGGERESPQRWSTAIQFAALTQGSSAEYRLRKKSKFISTGRCRDNDSGLYFQKDSNEQINAKSRKENDQYANTNPHCRRRSLRYVRITLAGRANGLHPV